MADSSEETESVTSSQSPDGQHSYHKAEQELQDHILAIYGTSETNNDMFRPALADSAKIGFFSLDRASQTEVTEIVDLKEMTEVLQILLQDVANLRRDINFTKHVMQADHDSKLQEKSLELYCRINERVVELEKMHQDRVNSLRKAFRQQLADAIARLSVHFSKNLQTKMVRERTKQKSDLADKEEKFKEMQATILRNEGVIQMLKAQLQQQQMRQQEDEDERFMERRFVMDESSTYTMAPKGAPYVPMSLSGAPSVIVASKGASVRATAVTLAPKGAVKGAHMAAPVGAKATTPRKVPRVDSALQEQLAATQDELDEARGKLEKTEKKISRLEEALDIKDEEISTLHKDMDNYKEQLERTEIMVEQLKHEQNEMAEAALKEKESTKKLLGHQKEEMKRMMDEQIRLAKEEALEQAREEASKASSSEQVKMKQMKTQLADLEKQLAKEKEKSKSTTTVTQESVSSKTLKDSEDKLKAEILRLQTELEKTHRTWEKKFAILQQSMHALKDESYLRQTLQRQAAQLHQAAVSYSVDMPSGMHPKAPSSSPKKPLPDIRRGSKGGNPQDRDYISYTVSAPSGRGTAMFSTDENQIMSDNEMDMMPPDAAPLPEPPARRRQDCGDESRPSTQPHVVVLPSVEAK